MSLSSVKQSRNSLVPILLNEFPIPPTFIPTTSNPPPSRPPTLPLPPIPGPSPLTNQDLFHITAAARSRRASRISTSSNSSWRDSVASLGSGSSHGGRNRTESVTSFSSNGALSIPRAVNSDHPRPSPISMALNPAILEDDELVSNSTAEPSLTRTSLSDIPRATPSPLPSDTGDSTLRHERISSIDMRDLPALQDDDTVDPDSQAHTLHAQMRSARSKVPTHKVNTRQAMPQLRRNTSPTGGKNHRRTASATQHSRDREFSHGAGHPPTAFPSKPLPDGSDRASSPDILTFIAATPHLRRRSETSSTRSRSRSKSRPRVPKSLPGSCRTSAVGRASVFSEPRRQSEGSATLASRSLLPYVNKGDEGNSVWNDGSFLEDYGVVINRGDGEFAVPDEEDTAGDSDSSLDLHTPLPSLMLRDGMLSPHSKLLPQNIRIDSPMTATHSSRPGSISNSTTKSGVFKDERDTIRRRVRHRDGRLLRGGIGLTTGLGWSDSEDEDAPSELTRRLSHLALSRESSAVTPKAVPRPSRSYPHSLSRSYSADATVHSSKSTQNMKSPLNPPTSWQKRNRTVASTLSLSIPESTSPEPVPSLSRFSEPPSSRVDIHAHSQPNDQVRTPSTSSTQSLPGPATPDVTDIPPSNPVIKSWGRDKVLPPLPLSRGPSIANLRPMESLSDMKSRALGGPSSTRPISSGSELSDSASMPPLTPKIPHGYTASTHPSTRTTPRPLQLSAFGTGLQPGEPASKQGLLLGYNRQLHDQQRGRVPSGPSPLTSSSPRYSMRPLGSPVTTGVPQSGSDHSISEMGELRLRPRIGTGMVYKKSSTSLTRAAADVQAQSRIRST